MTGGEGDRGPARSRPVHVSTTGFTERRLGDILSRAAAEGIGAIELSDVRDPDLSVLEPARDAGTSFLVHNYFPPPADPFLLNLASPDPDNLERSRAHCRAAIDLSARLGAPAYGAHAGFAYDLPPALLGHPAEQAAIPLDAIEGRDRTLGRLVESARLLAEHGESRGVRFLLENHVCSPLSGEAGRRMLPACTPGDLVELVDAVAHPWFGILFDTGHAMVSAGTFGFSAEGMLEAVAPHVGGLQLSVNDGIADQHQPFGPDAWFLPWLRRLPDATLTAELAASDPAVLRATVAVIREAS
ncbi:MAG TPA: sugar phosphate isomerase/epimerase family protein [Candidatus Limnocylindrales bacterium]|nr:sugar phosphate isomerase/epimerase family protein [Candidatus Limnocylindrales bacterium]